MTPRFHALEQQKLVAAVLGLARLNTTACKMIVGTANEAAHAIGPARARHGRGEPLRSEGP